MIVAGIDLGSSHCRTALWNGSSAEVFTNRLSGRKLELRVDLGGPSQLLKFDTHRQRFGSDEAAYAETVAMLREAWEDAQEAANGPVSGVVLTVPCGFTERQRALMRDAAREAGIPATRLLDEPVALAIGAGIGAERSLIFLLGAAFCQAAIVVRDGLQWTVHSMQCNPALGGNNLDAAVIHLILQRLSAE